MGRFNGESGAFQGDSGVMHSASVPVHGVSPPDQAEHRCQYDPARSCQNRPDRSEGIDRQDVQYAGQYRYDLGSDILSLAHQHYYSRDESQETGYP